MSYQNQTYFNELNMIHMDKIYIIGVIQNILNAEFKSGERRRINEYHDRINFCCPVCGDGKSDNKKRGNLYFNRLIFVCFNCGKKTSFDRIAKDFHQQIDPDKKLEIINYLDRNLSYKDYEDDIMETNFDKLLDMGSISEIFNSGDFAVTDFKPIESKSPVYNYLVSRNIPSIYHTNIYQAKYWYNSDKYENIMCLLNRRGDKIIGMQVRNLKEGKKRMFKIYNYETLYKWIYNIDDIIDIEINQIIIYNKISCYFNILNIDFSKTISIFEGYLDSLFYPNSVGVVGVNTDFSFLESNNLQIQYFFDNDIAGYEKSEEKIRKGHSVFLWKKLFENIVKNKSLEDPYKLMYRINKIKDLNSLSELVPNPYKKLNLQNFFSNDIMDLKFIPKKDKKIYKKLTK